jgi:hypothetical protein
VPIAAVRTQDPPEAAARPESTERSGYHLARDNAAPRRAAGEVLLTAAIREPSRPAPSPPATAVTNGRISGLKVGVPYAAEAYRILVPARLTPRTS